MSKSLELYGKRFGRLIVVERAENSKSGKSRWVCQCDCGNETIVSSTDLTSGHTKSCGCLKFESRNFTHKMRNTKLYSIWCEIKKRCYYKSQKSYKYYGGRGITMCSEWKNDFVTFMDWAYSNGYKEGLSIERIDNNKGYYPDNCKWIELNKQNANRRNNIMITYNGETMDLMQWCKLYDKNYSLVWNRIRKYGYTFENAMFSDEKAK